MLNPKEVLFGLSIRYIVETLGVDVTTARRWKRGAICPPQSALWALDGDLGHLDAAWRGWKVRRGNLVSREGWEIGVNDVLSTPLLRAQLASYQSANRALKYELDLALTKVSLDHLEEQPTPDSWDVQIVMG